MNIGQAEVRGSGLTRRFILGALACIALTWLLASQPLTDPRASIASLTCALRAERTVAMAEPSAALRPSEGQQRDDELRAVESEDSEHDASVRELEARPATVARGQAAYGSEVERKSCAPWAQQHARAPVQARAPPVARDATLSADKGSV